MTGRHLQASYRDNVDLKSINWSDYSTWYEYDTRNRKYSNKNKCEGYIQDEWEKKAK